MIVLYRSTLLSSDAGDFLPMTQHKSFTFRSICFLFLLYAVPTLAWNPNVGQGTSQLVIVESLYCLCVLLDAALSSARIECNTGNLINKSTKNVAGLEERCYLYGPCGDDISLRIVCTASRQFLWLGFKDSLGSQRDKDFRR
jgi:hypothetical protein